MHPISIFKSRACRRISMQARHARSLGFTLIEILASMAILLLIVLFIGRLFGDASNLWKLGNRRVTQAMDGRAVIAFMVRELSSTIADSTVILAHHMNATNVLGMDADFIFFASADQEAELDSGDTRRQVKQVSYHVKPMQGATNNLLNNRFCIVRDGRNKYNSTEFTAYKDKKWWTASYMTGVGTFSGDHVVLAENVRTLEFWIYDRDGKLAQPNDSDKPYGTAGPNIFTSDNPRGLGWIEIYIEMLGEDDAIKVSLLTGQEAIDFADRAARRYVGRVYLNNGRGYDPNS